MRPGECPRETELLAALRAGWPEGCPDDLGAHVAVCAACADSMEVARPLMLEQKSATREAPVPSSAAMWWRLELRARREATARAMRPIAAAQAVTLACALGLLVAVAGLVLPEAPALGAWLDTLGRAAAAAGGASLPSSAAPMLSPVGIALGLAGVLLLVVTPVAIYFALSDS